jgi:hypothetical protein
MADKRVRDYLGQRFEAARARESGDKPDEGVARQTSTATSMKVARLVRAPTAQPA